ncbi:hypothetical protein NPIL_148101 [Nephila pilipes]|uniref:Uncharacterized protein n=1 Tax=Nephila pilipes TaxID=299642 RepID=A0A8X6MCN0_NEPPI|nr:hypothetical protein NPIL_148101 [Nephila pilipes]
MSDVALWTSFGGGGRLIIIGWKEHRLVSHYGRGRRPNAACGVPLPHGVLLQAAAVASNPSSHPMESLGIHFAVLGGKEMGHDITIFESEYSAWEK